MKTYYVIAKMDNNPIVFKVNAENVLDAKDKVNEYCVKRRLTCYALQGFTESMLSELPYAIVTIECDDGKSTRLIELSDIYELKTIIKELREEHYECTVIARVTYLSDIELELARLYRLDKGYEIERSVEVAKIVAREYIEIY